MTYFSNQSNKLANFFLSLVLIASSFFFISSRKAKTEPTSAVAYFEAKLCYTTGPVAVKQQLEKQENITVVDVRDEVTYQKGHVPGAINLPKSKWGDLSALNKKSKCVVYCYNHVCHLAAQACLELAKQGYEVMELEGGYKVWEEMGMPCERKSQK